MAIVEVESKFLLSPEQRHTLLSRVRGGTLTSFSDTYYDKRNYVLTSRNWWLRRRGGAWELKVGHSEPKETSTVYEEVTGERAIARLLNISLDGGRFEQELRAEGYNSLVELITHRRTYTAGDFNITTDSVSADCGAFSYEICEIELLVPEGERDRAQARIAAYARELGFTPAPVRGKLIEYLWRHRKPHFDLLVERGVIDPVLS